ncbi:MAG: MBL fold metallo-hydrolase [Bacteroidetes Order II. Incertae sedis bacterium]|nr:MBL fold metallo-hydrolase [Bacteroidetes Order II. bacterium]
MPKIAGYELYTIESGRFGLDGGAMFGIIPKPMWEKYLQADARNRIPMNMRCLLLVGNNRVILIDTGLGDKFDAKFGDIYAVDTEMFNLQRSLKHHDIKPEDVTDVILSHLHFDHAGGSTIKKDGNLVTAFPNAVYHVQTTHWEWATQKPNIRERNSFLHENLAPLADSGQLQLQTGPGTLFEGVETLVIHGHTPGQQMIKVSDQSQTLVFTADLTPTLAHIPSIWVMGYDLDPLLTIAEKDQFLKQAAEHKWKIMYDHDPLSEISDITWTDRGPVGVLPRPLADL